LAYKVLCVAQLAVATEEVDPEDPCLSLL